MEGDILHGIISTEKALHPLGISQLQCAPGPQNWAVLKGSDLDHGNRRSDCLQNIHWLQHQTFMVLIATDYAMFKPSWSPPEARCWETPEKLHPTLSICSEAIAEREKEREKGRLNEKEKEEGSTRIT